MNSALYRGWVRHRRRSPRPHAFTVHLHLLLIDLAELPRLFEGRLLWSVDRPNLAAFRREDYLGDPALPLDEAVRREVQDALGRRPTGPIRLLTQVRTVGLCFNPVSFYWCFAEDGEQPDAIVAEITNTPWGERHRYVLDARVAPRQGRALRFRFPKRFHVSPFLPLDLEYDWLLTPPGPDLIAHLRDLDGETVLLDATLRLERRPLAGPTLARALLARPCASLAVLAAIYRQALVLWLKRTPFFAHPGRPRLPPSGAPS